MATELTKEEMFALEYIVDLNATKAYMRVNPDAAYSTCSTEGSKMLAKSKVKDLVDKLKKERAEKVKITAEDVLHDLIDIKDRCMQKERVMEFDTDAKCMMPTGEWQFKEQGALKAVELLGKHLKMFKDQLQLSGTLEKLSDEELEAQIESFKKKEK